MIQGYYFTVLLLFTLLSGCTMKPQESWDYDPQINWSSLKTWAWIEPHGKHHEHMIHSLMAQRIHRAVEKDLSVKGLKKLPAKDANIWLSWSFADKTRLEETRYNAGFSYYPYPWMMSSWPSETVINSYEEGYLTLNMINPVSKNLIWQGIAHQRITGDMSPETKKEYIDNAINSLFSKFPPGT